VADERKVDPMMWVHFPQWRDFMALYSHFPQSDLTYQGRRSRAIQGDPEAIEQMEWMVDRVTLRRLRGER
jgi:hypothetical protein